MLHQAVRVWASTIFASDDVWSGLGFMVYSEDSTTEIESPTGLTNSLNKFLHSNPGRDAIWNMYAQKNVDSARLFE